jgi:hypothetical protein
MSRKGRPPKKKPLSLAIAYDFDGTLAPGNMQERDFIPAIGMTRKSFWAEVGKQSKKHDADGILTYMRLMLEKAGDAGVPVRKEDFAAFGKSLDFFQGVLPYREAGRANRGWFERINRYGKESGVAVQHHVVSSGIREMIGGSRIAQCFKNIYASGFYYDHHGVARWPAIAVNYTTKTQFLFRINKGIPNVYDHGKINELVPEEERPVPFERMVFLGDGETDVPCFRLIKDMGGHAIAVYRPNTRGAKSKAGALRRDGWVHFIAPADYRPGRSLDRLVKAIIDKVAADRRLDALGDL